MSEPIIEYRDEFNVMDFVSKYAERVSRVIDEQTLANVEHQLARYGYVKVVRCSDCKYRYGCLHLVDDGDDDMRRCNASPDGFCSWGKPRGEGDAE